MVRMVTFRAHMRGEVLLKRGAEFEVEEEEAHAYASRKNPLAGRLDTEPDEKPEPVAAVAAPQPATPAAPAKRVPVKRAAKAPAKKTPPTKPQRRKKDR